MAIDPADPRKMIASWQVPATVAWSGDSGATWKWTALPATSRWQLSGDPVVAFDGDGRGYALYIAFDRPEDYDTLGRAAHRNGIFVNRSDDGGRTWRAMPGTVIEQPERAGVPFEDKPAIGIDRTAEAQRRGTVYVAWTEFRRRESVILFSRSSDSGSTFAPPITISDRPGSPKDSVGADEGTSIVVGRDGTVYVVWSDSTGIRVARSTDAGHSFGAPVLIARTPDIVFGVRGVARVNGYPSLAIDEHSGRLYVLWVDPRGGLPEPYIATSDDGAVTWSAPRAVSDGDSRVARFFASLAVDPKTGRVVAGYYRVAVAQHLEYMLATSNDFGASFLEEPWGRPFDPAGEFLGDYTGIDAVGGQIVGVWTEIARADVTRPTTGRLGRHDARVVIGRAIRR